MRHRCKEPQSNDFQDGHLAAGCWIADGLHYEQVVGSSGVYLIVHELNEDLTLGQCVRNDCP